MAMTVGTLKYLVQYLVGDPQLTTYSQQMYLDSINFACKEYAKKTGATYVETAVTPDANGFCAIPTPYIRIQRVLYKVKNVTNTQLVESTYSFESMKNPVWTNQYGTPKRWVLYSGAKVKLTPIPVTGAIFQATVGYVEHPADLASDSSTLDTRIPESHGEFLKYAAASWLLLLDGDGQNIALADNFMSKFNQMIGYADPVLDAKMAQSRTQGLREV